MKGKHRAPSTFGSQLIKLGALTTATLSLPLLNIGSASAAEPDGSGNGVLEVIAKCESGNSNVNNQGKFHRKWFPTDPRLDVEGARRKGVCVPRHPCESCAAIYCRSAHPQWPRNRCVESLSGLLGRKNFVCSSANNCSEEEDNRERSEDRQEGSSTSSNSKRC
jgi:hypothetical protein